MPTEATAADHQARQVLGRYAVASQFGALQSLGGAGGFSGSRLWRITPRSGGLGADVSHELSKEMSAEPHGELILRRWPSEGPSPDRLRFIHSVMQHAAARGFDRLPLPLPNFEGDSFIRCHGHLWELAPWLEGESGDREPATTERTVAALDMLARFHQAVEDFPRPTDTPRLSPGLGERSARIARLEAGEWATLAASLTDDGPQRLCAAARRILDLGQRLSDQVARRLRAAQGPVALQPCLRDVHSAHVLFVGPRVSGLIDFGALRPENVAADVARLLGSMAGDGLELWEAGMDAYRKVRHLDGAETRLVTAFDESTTLLAGVNWISWIFRDRRQFDDLHQVAGRMEHLVGRLECLARRSG